MVRIKSSLTRRELEVLSFLSKGFTTKEVAQKLLLSHETVKSHRAKLMLKMDARNAFHLGVLVAQQGLLDTPFKLIKLAS